jgi:hypothetical protein
MSTNSNEHSLCILDIYGYIEGVEPLPVDKDTSGNGLSRNKRVDHSGKERNSSL